MLFLAVSRIMHAGVGAFGVRCQRIGAGEALLQTHSSAWHLVRACRLLGFLALLWNWLAGQAGSPIIWPVASTDGV